MGDWQPLTIIAGCVFVIFRNRGFFCTQLKNSRKISNMFTNGFQIYYFQAESRLLKTLEATFECMIFWVLAEFTKKFQTKIQNSAKKKQQKSAPKVLRKRDPTPKIRKLFLKILKTPGLVFTFVKKNLRFLNMTNSF